MSGSSKACIQKRTEVAQNLAEYIAKKTFIDAWNNYKNGSITEATLRMRLMRVFARNTNPIYLPSSSNLPLHIARRSNYKLHPDAVTFNGTTMLEYAIDNNLTKLAALLIKYGADAMKPCTKVGGDNLSIMCCICTEGAYLGQIETDEVKDHAKKYNDLVMLFYKLNPHRINQFDVTGDPIMHLAADVGNHHLIKPLKDLGADLNVLNHNGETPLYRACINDTGCSFPDFIKELAAHGVDINARFNVKLKDGTVVSRTMMEKRTEEDGAEYSEYIRAGFNPNTITPEGKICFFHMIDSWAFNKFHKHLNKHDLNLQEPATGNTFAHHIIYYAMDELYEGWGSLSKVLPLVAECVDEGGMNVSLCNNDGYTIKGLLENFEAITRQRQPDKEFEDDDFDPNIEHDDWSINDVIHLITEKEPPSR